MSSSPTSRRRGLAAVALVTAAMITVASACARSSAAPPTTARDARVDTLEQFLRGLLGEFPEIPGMAVAVVRDTQIVYLEAHGYRDLEARLPATAVTPFYIASSTKSFTAMAAAVLAERGVVDLDAPIARYLPELELPAPRSADSITLRQLLTHTAGFRNTPVVIRTAYTGEHTPEQLVAILARSEVREQRFRYDNIGYVVASLVLDRVTGAPWQRTLDRTLFEPLGMSRTSAYMSEAGAWGLAAPYRTDLEGRPVRLPQLKRDETMHAAGGMVTTAADLTRWLEAQLNAGRVDGRQVLPAAAVREAHRMQATLGARFGPFRRYGYGLGWYWSDYDGDTLLHHFGGYAGARAHVSFMPTHGIGVAVLVNTSGPASGAADLAATYAYDLLLGKPGRDAKFDSLLAAAKADIAAGRERARQHVAERQARTNTLTRPLGAYVGRYISPELGTLVVDSAAGALRLRLGQLESRAEPFTRADAVRVEFDPGSGEVVQFHVSPAGVDSATTIGVVFRRER